jgi:choline dehydrogenase-like flavoprotein
MRRGHPDTRSGACPVCESSTRRCFPVIPSVNPMVTVMLVAERAADLIRQDEGSV